MGPPPLPLPSSSLSKPPKRGGASSTTWSTASHGRGQAGGCCPLSRGRSASAQRRWLVPVARVLAWNQQRMQLKDPPPGTGGTRRRHEESAFLHKFLPGLDRILPGAAARGASAGAPLSSSPPVLAGQGPRRPELACLPEARPWRNAPPNLFPEAWV